MTYRFFLLSLIFVLLCLNTWTPAVVRSADPKSEYEKIKEKMKEQKDRLQATEKRESSLLSEIEEVSMQLEKVEAELRLLREKLRGTETAVTAVLSDIGRTERSVIRQEEWLKRKLRRMYMYGRMGDSLLLLLGVEDLPQLMRTSKYMDEISRTEERMIADYRSNLGEMEKNNQQLQNLKAELISDRKNVQHKQNEIVEQKKAKHLLLTSVRSRKAEHQKMISELEEASKKLLEIIREAEKQEAYSGKGFQAAKKKLAWPVSGDIALPYGSHKDPQFDTPVFRHGIHISTNPGAEVKSVFNGKVIFADWFKGFGQLVIVNHGGGYHTLYGNLSEIFSHAGDIIKGSHVIGKVGTSSILNSPGLYFEIRYKGKPLNPGHWLKGYGG